MKSIGLALLPAAMLACTSPGAAAAPPPRGISLDVQGASTLSGSALNPRRPATAPRTAYQPAPLPNRDIDGPVGPRGDGATSVSPGLVTRNDTYRGEGFARGSSASSEQERRVRPGAAINLRMPLVPN